MTGETWTPADSWVLTAVAISRRAVDLQALIAAGDACTHAILERSEIERGLGRLAASGLVHVEPGLRVSLTKAGKRITRKAKGGIIERSLHMPECLREVPLREAHISVTPDEYTDALARYKSRR